MKPSLWGTVPLAPGGAGGVAPALVPAGGPGGTPWPGACPPGSRGALSVLGNPEAMKKPWIPSNSVELQKIEF